MSEQVLIALIGAGGGVAGMILSYAIGFVVFKLRRKQRVVDVLDVNELKEIKKRIGSEADKSYVHINNVAQQIAQRESDLKQELNRELRDLHKNDRDTDRDLAEFRAEIYQRIPSAEQSRIKSDSHDAHVKKELEGMMIRLIAVEKEVRNGKK
ncbi:hypothetical protein OAF54_01795 [bacterium]|nr:hypothetical protein [bacterium]